MYRIRQLTLLGGDIIMIAAGFWCGLALRHLAIPEQSLWAPLLSLFAPLMFLWLVLNYISGLYDLTKLHLRIFAVRRLAETTLLALAISMSYLYLFAGDSNLAPKTTLVLTIFCSYSLLWIWRQVYLFAIQRQSKQLRILFIGDNPTLDELIKKINTHYHLQYNVVGLVSAQANVQGVDVFSSLYELPKALKKTKANMVIISPDLHTKKESMSDLYKLLFTDVAVMNLTNFYEEIMGRIPPYTFSEQWFLEHLDQHKNPMYDQFRTITDYIFALIIGSIFLVTFPIIALAIKLTSRGPVFYKQKRVGQYGNVFYLYKYRSMYALSADGSAETGGVQFAKKGDKRVTTIGKLLRKTRIDEWPQVLNLLKRDITLIGPRPERPEIVEELERRMPYYSLRHIVRPGLSGWAVIHQNYTDTYESSLEKLQYDLYYIKHRSLTLDMTITLKTLNLLLRFMGQ